jgi:hypothetical protein
MAPFFHSTVDTSDNEDQRARGGQRQPEQDGQQPVIPPVMPGISPEFVIMFQAFSNKALFFSNRMWLLL